MTIIITTGKTLSRRLHTRMARYRHDVFIDALGWQMDTDGQHELDQFDRPDTRYVLSQDAQGRLNGCARLLPTEQPYLLGKVFPQLMGAAAPPCCPTVWELSRFAALDVHERTSSANPQFSSPVAVALLQAALACAVVHGVERLITVSPLGVGRLLQRAGFSARRAGPPTVVDGHDLFACWIEAGTVPQQRPVSAYRLPAVGAVAARAQL